MTSKVSSKESIWSFSGKQPEENAQHIISRKDEAENENENLRRCTKSPTFDDSLLKDNEEYESKREIKTVIQSKTASPKSKKEIMKLFSIPKTCKKKLQSYFMVFSFISLLT